MTAVRAVDAVAATTAAAVHAEARAEVEVAVSRADGGGECGKGLDAKATAPPLLPLLLPPPPPPPPPPPLLPLRLVAECGLLDSCWRVRVWSSGGSGSEGGGADSRLVPAAAMLTVAEAIRDAVTSVFVIVVAITVEATDDAGAAKVASSNAGKWARTLSFAHGPQRELRVSESRVRMA